MQSSDKKLKELKLLLDEVEEKINAVKRILFEQVYQEEAVELHSMNAIHTGPDTIIEGVFNGEEMIDATGKKYPVPANYASKSKLVAGDKLKLIILPDGTFIFKQIGPVERKRVVGKLSSHNDHFHVVIDKKKYKVLQASVTYFHAKPGDQVAVLISKNGESEWAAIENCLDDAEKGN